jgi:hypothetical protein
MTERPPSFRLAHPQARTLATAAIWQAPDGWYARIVPPTRSLEANARFHAMLSDIVKSGYSHEGRKLDVDDLKTLFVSAWMIETGKGSDIVKGLRDEAVQLRRSTTTMSPAELGETMTIVEVFCAERGIKLRGDL